MPRRVPLPPSVTGAAFTVAQGRDAGLSEKRMRGSDLARPFRGLRNVSPASGAIETSAEVLADARAVCETYRPLLLPAQFFSHTTAALLWGCPLPRHLEPPTPIHVTSVAPARAPDRAGVVGHQTAHGRVTVVTRHGLPAADPLAVFSALAVLLELDDLVAVADHLILDPPVLDPLDIRPHITEEQLRMGIGAATGRGQRRARAALELMKQGAESRRESLLRVLLRRAGLPEPEVNPELYSDGGRWLGRADLVYRQWRVIVEYDGDHHRTDLAQYEKDITRIERFVEHGWIVVRVRARGLGAGAPATVARVERALTARGWRR